MRKSPSRAALDALHRLKMEPNTEGELDGLKWAGAPGLFVRWSHNTQSWVFRWNVRGEKRVMGPGSRREVTDHQAFGPPKPRRIISQPCVAACAG
jgi:hypothetical protein